MELQLKNIGMIKEAKVKIDGLTVIAGENDTGKSTVGKVIFCIIKAISRYEEDFKESKIFKIEEILDRLFFYLRRNINFEDDDNAEDYYDSLKEIFSLDYYLENKNDEQYINDLIKPLEIWLDETILPKMKKLISELEFIMKTPEDKNKLIENALNKVFRSEFDSNIVSFEEDIGFIKLFENNLILLDLKIENNKIKVINEVEPIEFDEVTFIETPLIFNNHDMLARSQTGLDITKRSSRRLGVPYTTLHTKDLFDKLKSTSFGLFEEDDFKEKIQNSIINIINGKIIYDVEERDFVYIKNGQKIPIKNTATGIKAFGIIQLLIENDFINRKSILVLDEPEIHIHPKWQLKYAQLISILVKNEIPIIVTSHSPYIIDALKYYIEKENLNSNFYLAQKNKDETSSISDMSMDISPIFEKLTKPLRELRKMKLGLS